MLAKQLYISILVRLMSRVLFRDDSLQPAKIWVLVHSCSPSSQSYWIQVPDFSPSCSQMLHACRRCPPPSSPSVLRWRSRSRRSPSPERRAWSTWRRRGGTPPATPATRRPAGSAERPPRDWQAFCQAAKPLLGSSELGQLRFGKCCAFVL